MIDARSPENGSRLPIRGRWLRRGAICKRFEASDHSASSAPDSRSSPSCKPA